MKTIVAIALIAILAGCAMPETTVKTGAPRPQVAVKGAPADAELLVDGMVMGQANRFDGNPATLIVEEGLHQVEIRRAGKAIHTEKAFVSNGETRVINVHSGGQ
jgi:hypothetical protein